MIRAIVDDGTNANHGKPSDHASLHSLAHAFLNGRNVLFGNCPTDNFVEKLEATSWPKWLNPQVAVTILTTTTCLTDEATFGFRGLGDCLAVGDLRLTDVRLDAELAQHPVDDNFEVKLTHTRDNGLPRLGIGANSERWVFFGQA